MLLSLGLGGWIGLVVECGAGLCSGFGLLVPLMGTWLLFRAARNASRRKQPRPPKAKPPEPSAAERLAAAKAKYHGSLRLLDQSGLEAGYLRAAKEKAKRVYMKELDGLL